MMKVINNSVYCVVLVLILLLTSCGNGEKKTEELSLTDRMTELAQKYVKQELEKQMNITGLDSIRVVKIDTVDKYEYICVVQDILPKMRTDAMMNYQVALEQSDSAKMKELEIEIDEMEQVTNFYEETKSNTSEKDKTLFLYLITANYYAKSGIDSFYFFVTPDYKIYILDPFDTSLLEK